MKCEECLQLIDLHFDGELSPREAAAVAAHVGGCESCAREYQKLRAEQSLYLRYGCDSTESPSFWDDVLSRAEADRVSDPDTLTARLRRRLSGALSTLAAPRFSPTVTAAMLLAAVAVTIVIMKYALPRDNGPGAVATSGYKGSTNTAESQRGSREDITGGVATSGTVAGDTESGESGLLAAEGNLGGRWRGRPETKTSGVGAAKGNRRMLAPTKSEPGPERLIHDAEQKYLRAIAALSRDVGRRRPQMDLETITRFERTLAVVDKAIAETRAAARKHPRDPVVVQYMMAAYAKKVDLLRGMAQD